MFRVTDEGTIQTICVFQNHSHNYHSLRVYKKGWKKERKKERKIEREKKERKER